MIYIYFAGFLAFFSYNALSLMGRELCQAS
jgi:hypothetical protein